MLLGRGALANDRHAGMDASRTFAPSGAVGNYFLASCKAMWSATVALWRKSVSELTALPHPHLHGAPDVDAAVPYLDINDAAKLQLTFNAAAAASAAPLSCVSAHSLIDPADAPSNVMWFLQGPRARKKRCIAVEPGAACWQCRVKRRPCDLNENDKDDERQAQRQHIVSQSPSSTCSLWNLPLPAGIKTPYPAECDELVGLYFDMIHYKQHLLFHPPTFMQEFRDGWAVDYIVLGMMALGARFSNRPAWQNVPPTERSHSLLTRAIDRFHQRAELVSIVSLQGAMLLGYAAFVEGATEQESLLGAQAIRMVQLLGLKDRLEDDLVQREVANALLWQAWTMDAWHAGRGGYPRQVELPSDQPQVLEELEFIGMTNLQPDCSPSLLNRNGIWTAMLPLHQMLNEVMHLNSSLKTCPPDSAETKCRVRQLDRTLQTWLERLPVGMSNSPTNLARYTEQGLGRTFLVMHVVYHHVAQLLFFHALTTKSTSDAMTMEECESNSFVAKCKSHATALSELMWKASRAAGLECLWSPGNGHLLVVASCVHMHSLLLDDSETGMASARTLLEQNFTLLMELRKYWPGIERSQSRLRSFHRACQLSRRLASVFDMDEWMIQFLIADDKSVPDRFEAPAQPSMSHEVPATVERDIDILWKELHDGHGR